MPPDEEERLVKVLIEAVNGLVRDVEQIRAYRENTTRALMGVYTRLVNIEDMFETDRAARVARQAVLDGQIARIQNWLRGALIVALIIVSTLIGYLVL